MQVDAFLEPTGMAQTRTPTSVMDAERAIQWQSSMTRVSVDARMAAWAATIRLSFLVYQPPGMASLGICKVSSLAGLGRRFGVRQMALGKGDSEAEAEAELRRSRDEELLGAWSLSLPA